MTRLIDAHALKSTLRSLSEGNTSPLTQLLQDVFEESIEQVIDAAPTVRCAECVFWRRHKSSSPDTACSRGSCYWGHEETENGDGADENFGCPDFRMMPS